MGRYHFKEEKIKKAFEKKYHAFKYFFDDEYYDKYEILKEKMHNKIDNLDEQKLRLLYIFSVSSEPIIILK